MDTKVERGNTIVVIASCNSRSDFVEIKSELHAAPGACKLR